MQGTECAAELNLKYPLNSSWDCGAGQHRNKMCREVSGCCRRLVQTVELELLIAFRLEELQVEDRKGYHLGEEKDRNGETYV